MNIKKFFADKGVGYFLTLIPFICAIIALVTYNAMGISLDFTEQTLHGGVLACLWITIVLLAASLVFNFKPIRYAAYLVAFLGLLFYFAHWGNIFGAIAMGGDGDKLPNNLPKFVTPMIFIIITFVLSLVSAILANWRPWAKTEAAEA